MGMIGMKFMTDSRQAESPFKGAIAVVTGASSGIGRAIALRLARQEAIVCAAGRSADRLRELEAESSRATVSFQVDLTIPEQVEAFAAALQHRFGRIDILVHGAGIIHQSRLQDGSVQDLDDQYASNLRGPYLLTKALLEMLKASHGEIVFINSSAGLAASRADIGQYAATKHGLRAMADSLRHEVNPSGVRVLTVYAGRTATPMQETLCRTSGVPYAPHLFLQPDDVASVVVSALMLPRTAEVTDVSVRPMAKYPHPL